MSDERALLAAIWEHPHEDTPRLVYADWLTETEDPLKVARAEFIRLQCERARLCEWDDETRVARLKQREEEMWPQYRSAWKADLPKQLYTATFRRGFVYPRVMGFGGEKFLKVKRGAFDAAPQWAVNLSKMARLFDKVFASPLLIHFDHLSIDAAKYPGDPFERLAGNDRLRNVSELIFYNAARGVVKPASVTAFVNGPAVASLTSFHGHLTRETLDALAACPRAPHLTELALWLDADEPAGALFSAERFPKLRSLRLRIESRKSAGAAISILTATPDTQLRKLDLNGASLRDDGLEQLAAWPGLARIRWLDLDWNWFDIPGYLALARSPHASNLKYLKVHKYSLNELPSTKAELDARFGSVIHYA